MKLFNTLSQKVEEFKPIDNNKVGIYTCGPTVYASAHIGNLRAYIFGDTLKRVLKFCGFHVKQVMNITDIDDKTIRIGEGEKDKFEKLTRKYEDKFLIDIELLNNEKPEIITRATEYIDKMVSFIEDLIEKGYAYSANDGSVYFSIEKFAEYGKLSRLDKSGLKSGARVAQDEYDKENPADFVLWKSWDENDGEIFWETSLGKGRPGWHIECSTMSMDKLGETIDIHTGGVDNIFPHHENEIAQSESRTGKKFVNYWLHNEHLLVDGRKMSKSLDNFYTLDDILAKGFSALDFRYFVLGAHYRSKLNFTWVALDAAKNARDRLVRIIENSPKINGQINNYYLEVFLIKVSDDLNLSEGLAVMWEMLRDENVKPNDKHVTLLKFDEVLGLGLDREINQHIPEEIIEVAEKRKLARMAKDFASSDLFRDQLKKSGWEIEDQSNSEYKLVKI